MNAKVALPVDTSNAIKTIKVFTIEVSRCFHLSPNQKYQHKETISAGLIMSCTCFPAVLNSFSINEQRSLKNGRIYKKQ